MSDPVRGTLALERRWLWLRGEGEGVSEPDLVALVRVLDDRGVAYALTGDAALRIHRHEPQTPGALDVAVLDRMSIPGEGLARAGFRCSGRSRCTGPDGTRIRFTEEPRLAAAVRRAVEARALGTTVRLLRLDDLLHEKLRGATDRMRRRSKRLRDLAKAQSLLEQHPSLEEQLTPEEKAALDGLPL
jgi:hypothetical protein